MDAGRSRVSVRRNVQALSGVVIRQRPRVGSRAVIPSLAYGRPFLEELAPMIRIAITAEAYEANRETQ
jgi:hypothetical protein